MIARVIAAILGTLPVGTVLVVVGDAPATTVLADRPEPPELEAYALAPDLQDQQGHQTPTHPIAQLETPWRAGMVIATRRGRCSAARAVG